MNTTETQINRFARSAGQILGGFAIGILVVIAVIEVYGQIGNMNAFEYQGY